VLFCYVIFHGERIASGYSEASRGARRSGRTRGSGHRRGRPGQACPELWIGSEAGTRQNWAKPMQMERKRYDAMAGPAPIGTRAI
jgi:hypothetical protein